MATEAETSTQVHGGRLIAARLRAHGVTKLFTLSGGHLFSIYDGCRAEGIEIVDVRHEQTAAFAAEGWAKVTRTPGVCALTAGPGVTNGMSAIASASQNRSPMLVLGGRAPQFRWGQGSLQEIDHVPFVRPLVKLAATAQETAEIPALVDEAMRTAITPHSGPVFLDFPLDYVFGEAGEPEPAAPLPEPWRGPGADGREIERVAVSLRDAERPVIMAGAGLYWGRGEESLRALTEELRIPVFLNGLARGCLPADHELAFSRARSTGLQGADVALVIGAPLDFRLGFGAAFAQDAEIVAIDVAEPDRDSPRQLAAELYGALPATLDALRAAAGSAGRSPRARRGSRRCGRSRTSARAVEAGELADERAPASPDARLRRADSSARPRRDRRRRRWRLRLLRRPADRLLRAGLLARPRAARLPRLRLRVRAGGQARPSRPAGRAAARRRRLRLLRDGARHARPPRRRGRRGRRQQRHLGAREAPDGGASTATPSPPTSAPQTRYDQVAEALGCHGELVSKPSELRPALERAFDAGGPALVNVLTDPAVAYPRRSNLA